MPIFNVLTTKGGTGNALKSGDRRATERQTKQEHEDLLDYKDLPEYNIVNALPNGSKKSKALNALMVKAQLMEKGYPKYWEDKFPRRTISQSSSWVGDVNYDPYSQVMTVDMGNNSHAYSSQSPEDVANFVNAPSMGKYWHDNLKK